MRKFFDLLNIFNKDTVTTTADQSGSQTQSDIQPAIEQVLLATPPIIETELREEAVVVATQEIAVEIAIEVKAAAPEVIEVAEIAPMQPVVETQVALVETAAILDMPKPEIKALTKTFKRGSVFYGVCPHCECNWNVGERVLASRASSVSTGSYPCCPSCRGLVELPSYEELISGSSARAIAQ